MLHQGPDAEPETVEQGELVLDDVAVGIAGVRIVPLVRTEPSEDKQGETDDQVGDQHVDPDVDGEGVEEGEEAWILPLRSPE